MKPFTMTWEKWKGLMLKELSQSEKDTKYHTIAFTCEFLRNQTNWQRGEGGDERCKPRNTLLTTENKLINTRGRGGDGESGDGDTGGQL